MRKTSILLALIFTITFSSSVYASNDMEDLKAGKPIVKEVTVDNKRETQLQLVVDRPIDKVWEVMIDVEHYTEFMPIQKVDIQRKKGENYILFMKLDSPPLIDISYIQLRSFDKDNYKVTFKKLSGGPFKSVDGWWKLEPFEENRTKIIYVNNIDVGRAVPEFVVNFFAKGSLYKMADFVKKRVETDGKWKR